MREENLLSIYLKEINKIPLLSSEEEKALALKAQSGDKAARDKLANANLRFVVNVAKKYQTSGMDLTDLISEGNIGLITAIEKFDVSKGYRFISYAVWWIRQSILKAVCEKSRAIRLPLNKANELVQIEHARAAVGSRDSVAQEYEEIAEMLNMDSNHVREMIDIGRELVSLDAEVSGKDGEHVSVGDFQEDTSNVRPEDAAMNTAMNEEIEKMVSTLKPTEASVIKMRYGLNGAKPMSLQEVGEQYSLTKERIRQIEKRAITRLQHPSRISHLEGWACA